MCNDRIIRRFAGTFILLSLALGWFVNPAWFLFTAFVGVVIYLMAWAVIPDEPADDAPR